MRKGQFGWAARSRGRICFTALGSSKRAPFGEVEAPASFVLPRATLRVTLSGGARFDTNTSVHIWLAAARVEACPLALGNRSIRLRPCAAVDGGTIGASAARVDDIAGWAAAAAHARLGFELGRLTFEAQVGGIIPLTRYEVTVGAAGSILEQTKSIGFAADLGASFRLE